MSKAGLVYQEGDEPVPGYRLVKLLGGGGVGKAWRAVAPGGVDVAIKIVERLQEGGGRRELQGLEQIKNIPHSYVCKIYGFWAKNAHGQIVEPLLMPVSDSSGEDTTWAANPETEAVQLVIAMELGDETLADVYARHRQSTPPGKVTGLPVEQLLHYIETAGSAVDYLNCHHHICHCDIKPQNILMIGGEAKIGDFGLARHVVDSKETGTPAFTPQYGAPEMMVGATYHPRMDQYSLALTYAELRMGRFPFPAYTQVHSHSQLAALAREKWEGKYDLSDLPDAERDVLAKALSPDPDNRFASIGEMLKALRAAVFPVLSWSPSENRPPTKTSLRYREGDEPIPGYRLAKWLGGGGSGDTWRATAPGGVDVAIKIINQLQDGLGRRELQALQHIKNIRHTHLCTIHGLYAKDAQGRIVDPGTVAAEAPGLERTAAPAIEPIDAVQLVVVMELGDETLADLFARHQQTHAKTKRAPLPVDEAFGYIEAAGEAVDFLNRRHGICHCDLKPENILLIGDQAKVCDFGLARQVVSLTQTTYGLCTPKYGAPEIMLRATYHPRMDQFSLAVIYAELSMGRFPFPAIDRKGSDSERLAALTHEKGEGRFDLRDMPKAQRRVIAKALSPNPDRRYESIAAMLDALARAIDHEKNRWRRRLMRVAAVALVLTGTIFGVFHYLDNASGPPQNVNGDLVVQGTQGDTSPEEVRPEETGDQPATSNSTDNLDTPPKVKPQPKPVPVEPPSDPFQERFLKLLEWARSENADSWREAYAALDNLEKLARGGDDRWHVLFLRVLLELKRPLDSGPLKDKTPQLEELLQSSPPSSSPTDLADLFEALATRLENELRNGQTDAAGILQAWDLWSKNKVDAGQYGDRLERRLRVLTVIAALGDDSADSAKGVQELAEPLLEWVVGDGVSEDDTPWRSLVAAAWVETALMAPGSEETLDDARNRQIADVVRSASPEDAIYFDYVRFVQSLLDGREDDQRLEAGDRLFEEKIFQAPSASPPLRTVRCRTLAVHLLAAAAHDLRTPGADGITTEFFTSENAQQANKYLDLVRELWEQAPKVVLRSDISEPLCDDFVFAYWAAGRDLQEVHDMAHRRLASASTDPAIDPSAGPLLAVRARAARRLLENEGDNKSNAAIDQTLRAHAALLDWLFGSPLTGEAIEIRDQFLAEAVRIADLGDLQETLAELPLEPFVRQLSAPEKHILERLHRFREPEAVARIYWWHGKQLRRGFDDSESELRRVLHVLAISKWLGPTAECMAELGEILLRLPYHKRFPGLDDAILALANDALQLDSDFHGAKGLRGHVNLVRSREVLDTVSREKAVRDAIKDYREAQIAVEGHENLDPFRARYLVGLSAAYLDLAIHAAADQKEFGCDQRDEIRAAKEESLKEAIRYATEATKIEYRADAPEEAWIAKGHAEEDLAWHVGIEAYYEQAIDSFNSAQEEASRWRRQSAEAFFALARCRLRQVVRQQPANGAVILKQEVIENLRKAAQGVSEDHFSLPEIYHQLGDAYLCLYKMYAETSDETKRDIMAAYESASQAASRVSPRRQFMYQRKRAEAALLVEDDVQAGQLARELLEQADKWEAPAEELYLVLMLMLNLAMKERGPQIQDVRALVYKEIDRFPEDDTRQAWRRVWLLMSLSVVTREMTSPPDSLFDAALTDAQAAYDLLIAKPHAPFFGPSEHHFLLWKTQAALGEYYYWKWSLSKDLPGIRPQDPQQWRLQEIRYLSGAFQNFDQYKALCKTLPPGEIKSANEHRLDFAIAIEAVLKEFSAKLTPDQVKDLRKLGQEATNALRGAFPADSDPDRQVERLRSAFK
jgi:serine/threonine protein kinase